LDVDLEAHARDAEWLKDQGLLERAQHLITPGPIGDAEAAVELARDVRRQIGITSGPLGPLAEVGELFGLYISVVDRDVSGASLQMEPGFGVAVIGGHAQPGRRRWTAAHEIGHHLTGDAYHSDVGVAASDAEKEKVIDAFVGEFLLPTDDVRAAWSGAAQAEPYSQLVRIAAEYRLSWSSTIASASRADVIDRRDVQGLRARTPTRGDFLEIVGYEPLADLTPGTTGPGWKRAVFAAWRNGRISAERAVQLVQYTLTVGDLPQLEVFDRQ
jgi:Zn-dependent peptidase ImmA (M78 family)